MKRYFFQASALTISILFVLVTFVSAQKSTHLQGSLPGIDTLTKTQLKIIKSQGTGPLANIRCGLQDKAGNLWFGTTGNGVYRYDGKIFTHFTVKDGLSNNYVWCVYEDTTGTLWFGTADGASKYDGKKFTQIPITVIRGSTILPALTPNNKFKLDAYGNPNEENSVWCIKQDKTGGFWFGINDGVTRYNGKTFKRFSQGNGIIGSTDVQINKIESILEDNAGNIWLGGRDTKGVLRFDGRSLTVLKPAGSSWFWPGLQDKAGNIWFSNFGGVYQYDGKTFTNFTKKVGSCTKDITCIVQDKSGNIWFGSDRDMGGLCRYDGSAFSHFSTKDGLIINSVWTIVADKTGNLWIGTRGLGLYRYDGTKFLAFSE